MEPELTPLETCPHCKAKELENEAKAKLDLSKYIASINYYGVCDSDQVIINALKKIQSYINNK